MKPIERILIVKAPHARNIVKGLKTWEMRSTQTTIRGTIGIAESGSGTIIGQVDLIACRHAPKNLRGRVVTQHMHRLPDDQLHLMDKWKWAWVLENAVEYDEPVPYSHPQGAVIWVTNWPEKGLTQRAGQTMELTCGNCKELDATPMLSALVVGCKLTGFVIPHKTESSEETVTFWRVPIACPRKSGVVKSKSIVAEKDWVIKAFSDLRGNNS